jgi:hypothetical protein
MNEQTTTEANPTPAAQPPRNPPIDTVTLELLDRWMREDATDDPKVIRAREQELADFKRAMNENRALSGEPPVFP